MDPRREKAQEQIDEYKRVARLFSTPDGFEVLQALREVYFDQPTYRPGKDALESAYREGQRSVIAELMNTIELGKNPPSIDDLVGDEDDEEELD